MGRRKQNEDLDESAAKKPVGGIPFFLSLAVLVPLSTTFLALTLSRLGHLQFTPALTFGLASVLGGVIAHKLIVNHLSVLIHEVKHSIISNLVGNRHKGMTINRASGLYTYAYTKQTAHYNAFISLAPYIVPFFSFFGIVFGALFCRHDRALAAILVGLGYGIDMVMNARDVSPIQPDISLIRGGYWVGVAYIIAWNTLTTAIALSWALYGVDGPLFLLSELSAFFLQLYISMCGDPRT